jgi:membrane protease YdiL (CAAX protease family)
VLAPDRWFAQELGGSFGRFAVSGEFDPPAASRSRRLLAWAPSGAVDIVDGAGEGGLSGLGKPVRRRIEGWSPATLASRGPAIALVEVVALGAIVRSAAPFVFVGLLTLYLVLRQYGRRSVALAAVMPAAAILVWRSIPQPLADPVGADCANLFSPPAVWRFLEGILGLGAVIAMVIDQLSSFRDLGPVRGSLRELGLVRGSPTVRWVAAVGFLLIGPIALYASTILGRTGLGGIFFGTYAFDFQPLALLPAIVFAASNAVAEELAYRGAMRIWLTPSLGIVGANLAQAILFGLSHTGDDFVSVAAAVPTAAAMVLVGFAAGVIARRTGSLAIPLAIHAAADIPIYFYWACRVP